jgi:hypothetical protein
MVQLLMGNSNVQSSIQNAAFVFCATTCGLLLKITFKLLLKP